MSKKMIPLHVADQAVAACEAEIQKLREEVARIKAAFDLLDESIKLGPSTIPLSPGYYIWKESEQYALKEENAALKAEVERLTKAGDALAYRYATALSASYGDGTEEDAMDTLNNPDREELVNWNAAKEGKQP